MNIIVRSLTAAGVVLAATVVETPTVSAQAFCGNLRDFPRGPLVLVFGLTDDQRLVRFRECRPDNARDIGVITGLDPDTALVGIDFRIQDGLLYGLGDAGGLYTIDRATAVATPVPGGALTEALDVDAAGFDIDFNPAANALRIVSDAGQNLRHPFAGDTPFVTQVDADLNTGGAPAAGIGGVAYANNDLDPNTGTTLFDISSDADQVLLQSPPNDGVLVATGALTVDADAPVGFDIFSVRRRGVIVANRAFAVLDVAGIPGFYRINQLTGQAILIGEFGDDLAVSDIAIRLRQPPPAEPPEAQPQSP